MVALCRSGAMVGHAIEDEWLPESVMHNGRSYG